MSKRCPSCLTEVADDARVCPNCPWTFPDEDADNPPPAAVAQQWSPLPLVFLMLTAAVIGLGWYFVGKTYHEETAPDSPHPLVNAAPAPVAAPPAPVVPVTQAPPPAPTHAPAKPAKRRAPVEDDENDAGEAPRIQVKAEPAAPAPVVSKPSVPVKEWRLRGFVYDLISLQPVARCKIVLSDTETNSQFETATDVDGRYRAILPPLPDRGYLFSISASGYVTAYLNPGTEGVRHKSIGERQELCKELGTAIMQPASLQPRSAEPLVTDFFIAPVSCR